MKKILVSLLACAMILSLAACGKKDGNSSSGSTDSESSSSISASTSDDSSVSDDTSAPSEEIAIEEDPAEKEFYEAESKKVEEAILTALKDGKPAEKVENIDDKLQAAYEAVKTTLGENYVPSAPIDSLQLKEIMGVDEALIDSVIAEGPMISVHIDTFIGIKAKEGKGEEVEKALNAYRDYLVNDSMQYPMNLSRVNASKVIRDGDYVFFTMVFGNFEQK